MLCVPVKGDHETQQAYCWHPRYQLHLFSNIFEGLQTYAQSVRKNAVNTSSCKNLPLKSKR